MLKFSIIVITISRYICVSNVRLGGVYVSFKHKERAFVVMVDVLIIKHDWMGNNESRLKFCGLTKVTYYGCDKHFSDAFIVYYYIRSLLFRYLMIAVHTEKSFKAL